MTNKKNVEQRFCIFWIINYYILNVIYLWMIFVGSLNSLLCYCAYKENIVWAKYIASEKVYATLV